MTDDPVYKAGQQLGMAIRAVMQRTGISREQMADALRSIALSLTERAARDA